MKTLKILSLFCLMLIAPFAFCQEVYTYVSDAAGFSGGDFKIVQFDPNGENPIRYIDEELAWPQDIVFLEDVDRVLVSNLNSGRITRYNSRTGAYIDDFATVTGGPTRMRIGEDGKLWVVQWSNSDNRILRFELDGTPLGEFTNTGITQGIGLDWDDEGNFYVSSFGGGTVTEFNDTGIEQGIFADAELSGPTNVEIADGVMYVLDWNAGKCFRYDVASGALIDEFIDGLTNPEGIAIHPDGRILIGDNGTNSVRQFDTNGNDLGDYTTGGDLITPNAVVLRDASFFGLPDEAITKVFVTPTVGSTFHLDPIIAEDMSRLTIFSISGRLVETIDPKQRSWNATHLNEGIYFMVATTNSGKKGTQKIVVQKN